MRLNFSGVGEDEIREGIRRIGEVVREQVAMYGTLTGARPAAPARRRRSARAASPPRPGRTARAVRGRDRTAEDELAKILRAARPAQARRLSGRP